MQQEEEEVEEEKDRKDGSPDTGVDSASVLAMIPLAHSADVGCCVVGCCFVACNVELPLGSGAAAAAAPAAAGVADRSE